MNMKELLTEFQYKLYLAAEKANDENEIKHWQKVANSRRNALKVQ